MQYNEILQTEAYSFLKDKTKVRTVEMLVMGGSIAYGTNTVDSDVDIRGFSLENKKDLLGFSSFDNYVNKETDTTIYSFSSFIDYLRKCNPNVIELLGCKEEHYLQKGIIAEELLDKKDMFLSQRVINSFGGYSHQQLMRLKGSLNDGKLLSADEEKQHLLKILDNAQLSFKERYSVYTDKPITFKIVRDVEGNVEIKLNFDIHQLPVREVKGLFSELENITKTMTTLNHRNKKPTEKAEDKHAMHLIRLNLMLLDMLRDGKIITYREKDHDLLMSIRHGAFREKVTRRYKEDFWKLLDDLLRDIEYAKKTTCLPKVEDKEQIEDFMIKVKKKIILGGM